MPRNQQLEQYVQTRSAETADVITAALNATQTTYKDIKLADLTSLLNTFGLIRTLEGIVANPAAPQEVRDGLSDFLRHVNDVRQVTLGVSTSEVVRAKFLALCAGLAAIVPDAAPVLVQIRAMGVTEFTLSGRMLGRDVTVEEVDLAKARVSLQAKLGKLTADAQFALNSAEKIPASLSDLVTPLLA